MRDALLLESFKARGSAFPLSSCFFCISQQAICASKKANRSRSCASGEESDARTAAEILFCSMVVFFFSVSKGAGRSDVSIESVAHSERLVDGASARQNSFLRLGKGARHASRHRNALGDGREAGRRGVEHTAGDSSEKKRRGTAAVRGALGGGKLEGALLPFDRSRFGDVRERE